MLGTRKNMYTAYNILRLCALMVIGDLPDFTIRQKKTNPSKSMKVRPRCLEIFHDVV